MLGDAISISWPHPKLAEAVLSVGSDASHALFAVFTRLEGERHIVDRSTKILLETMHLRNIGLQGLLYLSSAGTHHAASDRELLMIDRDYRLRVTRVRDREQPITANDSRSG